MTLGEKIQHKIDTKTKPLGSLGLLEKIAFKIATIQETESPILTNPAVVVFAADHGLTEEKVSPFPKEVTWQMVLNFIQGGAAISVFCKNNGINLKVVDAGVASDLPEGTPVINSKIAYGTKNIINEPAMSRTECMQAIEQGSNIVNKLHSEGCNVIGFGEMGIGNTSSAALIMANVLNMPVAECAGNGTGQSSDGMKHKIHILEKCIEKHGTKSNPLDILSTYGGFEIAMMTGAFLQAKANKMIILVDGFISTSAFLLAYLMDKTIVENSIFAHCSNEQGHIKMLNFLNVEAILNIGMRLGEGSGIAVAYPIIKSSVDFLNEMASFEAAAVSNAD